MEFAYCTLDWNHDGDGHELWPVSTLFSNSVCARRSSRQHELWKARPLRKDVEQSSREFLA